MDNPRGLITFADMFLSDSNKEMKMVNKLLNNKIPLTLKNRRR